MSLKLQTMANEYFEIMIILKNLRTVKYEEAYFGFFPKFCVKFQMDCLFKENYKVIVYKV